jgi:glycine cleavage system H protein
MAEGVYPDDLRYHREHDWVRLEGDEAVFGITWFAQDALGEVVYFDPPAVGTQVTADEPYGELESVKAVSDVIAPLSGEVTGVNEAVIENPDLVNKDPYGDGWLIRVRLDDVGAASSLLDVAAYRALLPE